MLKSFKVKLGQLFEDIREEIILNGRVLRREEIASLISHIFPIALKGYKHLTFKSSWERHHRDSSDSEKQ